MPLMHGKSQKAFTHNVRTEMHHGKPQKQSLAIAYALKRKAKGHEESHGGEIEHEEEMEHESPHDRMDMHAVARHKAKEAMSKRERAIKMFEGGQVHDGYQSSKTSHITHPDLKDEEQDEYNPHEEPARKSNHRAMMEDEHKLGQHGEYEVGPEGPHVDAEDHESMDEHPVENQGEGIEEDMVGHIMKQRAQVFAKGGEASYKKAFSKDPHGPEEMKKGGHQRNYDLPEMKEHFEKLGKKMKDEDMIHDAVGKQAKLHEDKYAHGGEAKHRETGYEKGVNTQTKHGKLGESSSHYDTTNPELPDFYKKVAKSSHERNLQELKEMPAPKYAHGGGVEGTHMCKGASCMHMSHGGKAHHHYSEGGKVANEDLPIVDDMPAEYDDLHLRDDLHESYTGANSGDEIGDEHEDERRKDIVSKIMHSRKKKDRMPSPA